MADLVSLVRDRLDQWEHLASAVIQGIGGSAGFVCATLASLALAVGIPVEETDR